MDDVLCELDTLESFPEVRGFERGELCLREVATSGEAVGLFLDGFLEHIAHVTGIAEVMVLVRHRIFQSLLQHLLAVIRQRVLPLLGIHLENVHKIGVSPCRTCEMV